MKKIMMISLLIGQSVLAQQKPGRFTIDGIFSDPPKSGKIRLQFSKPNRSLYRDSSTLVSGRFHLEGDITEPTVAVLSLDTGTQAGKTMSYNPDNRYEVLLESGTCKLRINGKLSDTKVEGSRNQEEFGSYVSVADKLHKQMQPLNMSLPKVEREFDLVTYRRVKKELAELAEKERMLVEHYVNANPSSPVALYAVSALDRGYEAPLVFEPYFKKLDTAFSSTQAWKKMAAKVDEFSVFQPGDRMVDFSLPDTAGRQVKLSSFKGKYVFVDFWASWCGPCRAQSPFIKRVFEKFKDKPFHILGVAEDREPEKWMKAIHDDGVGKWTQVLDAWGKPEAIGKLYRISAIPQNFLVDPDGVIVARNLSGLELELKLNDILN